MDFPHYHAFDLSVCNPTHARNVLFNAEPGATQSATTWGENAGSQIITNYWSPLADRTHGDSMGQFHRVNHRPPLVS